LLCLPSTRHGRKRAQKINNVKILKKQSPMAKVMASTNVTTKLPNVVVGFWCIHNSNGF
jgi:hypothetical protein